MAGLLARAIDAMPCPVPMRIARMTLEMGRAVVMKPLEVETRVLRAGRRIQQVEAAITREGDPLARATALRMRVAEGREDAATRATAAPPPRTATPQKLFESDHPMIPGFIRAVEYERQGLPREGRATVGWTRMRCPLVEGEETSPVVRLATLSDFASGTGNPLDFMHWTSINPDLTLHVIREPRSDWIALEAETQLERDGTGQSHALFHDEQGPIARAQASLLVEPR